MSHRSHAMVVLAIGLGVTGCADNTTLPVLGGSRTSIRRVVPKGSVDTLSLSDSIAVAVDNSHGQADADLELVRVGSSGILPTSSTLGGGILRVHGSGTAGRASLRSGLVTTSVTFFVRTARKAAGAVRNFFVQNTTARGAIPLWTTDVGTDYIDPKDGSLKTIETITLQPSVTETADYLVQLADLSKPCDLPPRLVDLEPSGPPGDRIPLILIHGIQLSMLDCRGTDVRLPVLGLVASYYQNWDLDNNRSPFDSLLKDLDTPKNALLRARYHAYVLHYPTYQPIVTTSAFLRDRLATLPGGPPVIVTHSMGGLVARGMMGLSGAPPIHGLITIGTPHEGVPAASILIGTESLSLAQELAFVAVCPKIGAAVALAALNSGWLRSYQPITPGLRDLAVESDLVGLLKSNRPSGDRVYTIGGSYEGGSSLSDIGWEQIACLSAVLTGSIGSDGVVPISSALPAWSAGQQVIGQVTHNSLMESPTTFARVDDALTRLASCQPTTPPLTTGHPFVVSGTVLRRDATHIDITLNGIVINGVVQANLPLSAFTIVENGCAIPASDVVLTTGLGHVGVDLVFVQDLSGSMNTVIEGVKATVTSFAANLAAQGLDVRFGSVGYSGDVSTIPSTPAGARSEYVGPVQDVTDVVTFRNHVISSWFSGGGGDDPENGLEAMEYAMNRLTWRPGAVRVFVDITNSGHHTAADSCNSQGPCTDETLPSIATLLAGRGVLHAVAPVGLVDRTQEGSLDPWLVAAATGGKSLVLGNGVFDLNTIGITDAIAATTRLTFRSASSSAAPENLRILVTIGGKTAELAPGLLEYIRVPASAHQ